MKKIWMIAFGYWVVMSAFCLWLYPVLVYDPMARYAPMADAFARGDFAFAYHPRFGVLFTTLAGSVARLGFAGDHACQIVSIAFLAFSVIPIFVLVRKVMEDERIAMVTVLLVLTATEYQLLATDALRDTVRIFGLACCALSFVNRRAWPMAVGLFCLVTVRTDLFLISGAILLVWCICSFRTCWPAVGSWFVGANLMCFMTWCYTGIWLPGTQFVGKYLALSGGAS